MATLPILLYGDPDLRRPSKPVAEAGSELEQLAERMLETISVHRGVGLSAPQIGSFVRLIVVDARSVDPALAPMVMINPEITEYAKDKSVYLEGCLSIPTIYAEVERPEEITVRYQELNGRIQTMRCSGIPARVIQHEVDHLDGILFIDRLHPMKRWLMGRRLRKLKKKIQEKETREI